MKLNWKSISGLRGRPLVRDTVSTTVLSTLGRAGGLLIPFFIAAWFGVSSGTDAFFFSYGIILFASGIFASVIECVIVPYITEARSKNDDAGRLVGNILGVSGVALLALSVIVLAAARPVLSVLTRFDANTLDMAFRILLESMPLLILIVWASVLTGALNAYKKFALPAISPVFRGVTVLGFIFLFKGTLGVHAIACGYVAGEALRLAVLAGVIWRGALFRPRISLRLSPSIREFLKTASFQMIGLAALGTSPLIDKTMASWLGKGSVSVLYYAERLYMLPAAFVQSGLMVTLLTHFSERYYESGREQLAADIGKAVKLVGGGSLIIVFFLILLHGPVVNLVYGRGAFDRARLPGVGLVWICLLLGFVPYMLGSVYVKGHVVLKNTRVLMKSALYMCLLNVFFNYVLMKPFNIAGIALSTSLCYVFSFIYVLIKFRYQTRPTYEEIREKARFEAPPNPAEYGKNHTQNYRES
ncbi:MAG: polysaccharide biosynthesis C-terminal domain-containing protein [Nitrospiraceae bacterium]|nr:polysaccharide biosynthesis C-terminal domain-containing protein [Nitrospiraceae bacterium]